MNILLVRTGYVLAWKRDIAVLTAGNVKVTVNPRIRLMSTGENVDTNEPHANSYNLEIRDVRRTDAGAYVCQVGTMEPKEILHTLEVLGKIKLYYNLVGNNKIYFNYSSTKNRLYKTINTFGCC